MSPAITAFVASVALGSSAPPPESWLPVGETLTYRVKFSGMSAGTATMAVRPPQDVDGRAGVVLTMRTVSHGLMSRLVSVDDVATSFVDAATGGMFEYLFEKNENDRRETERLRVPAGAAAVESVVTKSSGAERKYQIALAGDGPPQDALSMFFFLRRVPLGVGQPVTLTVYQRKAAYPLRLTVVKRERVSVSGIGTFAAFAVRPEAAAPGLFAEEGDVTMWVEETTHVLLKMVIDLKVGSSGLSLTDARSSPLLTAPGASARR